ncbi:MAG: adenylate/guanylate cyclase domain-containing protein [Hyphomicrobiales bacterium]|nr:adenylate/guanylate cyclase domain-containing protein [Hyphomicrobiales bacterium]
MGETRKLAAILAADVVGYSRLTGADEERVLARLRALQSELLGPTIAGHQGRMVKRTGDGFILEFRSIVDAVRCAIDIQGELAVRNACFPNDQRIEFRVGIHLGDVVEEADGDLMGDVVNIAARLEGVCKAGAICLSAAAHELVRDRLRESFADLGGKRLKNISRPVRVFELSAFAIAKAKGDAARLRPTAAKMTLPVTANFLSKGGLAVLFLVALALFIDERPLLGYLGSVIGAEEGLVRNIIVSGFLVLAAVMSVVTWAEWRKVRSARAIERVATAGLRRDRPQDAQADSGQHT